MSLVFLDGDDNTPQARAGRPRLSRDRWAARPRAHTWQQEEARDFERAHLCRRCGKLIPAGRLHLRIHTGDEPIYQHIGDGCWPEAILRDRGQWASGVVVLIAAAAMLVIAAMAWLGTLR